MFPANESLLKLCSYTNKAHRHITFNRTSNQPSWILSQQQTKQAVDTTISQSDSSSAIGSEAEIDLHFRMLKVGITSTLGEGAGQVQDATN